MHVLYYTRPFAIAEKRVLTHTDGLTDGHIDGLLDGRTNGWVMGDGWLGRLGAGGRRASSYH